MNEHQDKHLLSIISGFNLRVTQKYKKGALEHGGELIQKDPQWVLDQAIDEAIDQVVYLLTLKQQLKINQPVDLQLNEDLAPNEE